MQKEKNAVQLAEIMCDQLDKIIAKNADKETRLNALAVSNVLGRIFSQAKLEVYYANATGKSIPLLPCMMRPDTPKRKK